MFHLPLPPLVHQSCQALAEGLKANSTLLNLNLALNDFGPEGAKAWCLVRMVWRGKAAGFHRKDQWNHWKWSQWSAERVSRECRVDLCWYQKLNLDHYHNLNDFEELGCVLPIGQAHFRDRCMMILHWLFWGGQIDWGLDWIFFVKYLSQAVRKQMGANLMLKRNILHTNTIQNPYFVSCYMFHPPSLGWTAGEILEKEGRTERTKFD